MFSITNPIPAPLSQTQQNSSDASAHANVLGGQSSMCCPHMLKPRAEREEEKHTACKRIRDWICWRDIGRYWLHRRENTGLCSVWASGALKGGGC